MHEPQFLYLSTIGWRTGNQHVIEIWFVEHDKKFYVMSENHKRSHWVKNISRNSKVSFRIGSNRLNATAKIINKDDAPELASAVARLMKTKYDWDEGLIVELAPLIR